MDIGAISGGHPGGKRWNGMCERGIGTNCCNETHADQVNSDQEKQCNEHCGKCGR